MTAARCIFSPHDFAFPLLEIRAALQVPLRESRSRVLRATVWNGVLVSLVRGRGGVQQDCLLKVWCYSAGKPYLIASHSSDFFWAGTDFLCWSCSAWKFHSIRVMWSWWSQPTQRERPCTVCFSKKLLYTLLCEVSRFRHGVVRVGVYPAFDMQGKHPEKDDPGCFMCYPI